MADISKLSGIDDSIMNRDAGAKEGDGTPSTQAPSPTCQEEAVKHAHSNFGGQPFGQVLDGPTGEDSTTVRQEAELEIGAEDKAKEADGPERFHYWIVIAFALELTFTGVLLPLAFPMIEYMNPLDGDGWFAESFAHFTGFDFRVERGPNIWKSACSVAFGAHAAGLLFTFLDILVILFDKWDLKAQGRRAKYTFKDFVDAVALTTFNIAFSGLVLVFPALHLMRWLYGDARYFETDKWVWYLEIPKWVVVFYVQEFYFYWSHRALHSNKWLYTHIHKVHHRFRAPFAFSSNYMHPLEYVVSQVPAAIFMLVLTNPHPYTVYAAFCFGVVSAAIAHSGFKIIGAHRGGDANKESHDGHHELGNCSFGNGKWDKLMGTDFDSYKKKVLSKKQ